MEKWIVKYTGFWKIHLLHQLGNNIWHKNAYNFKRVHFVINVLYSQVHKSWDIDTSGRHIYKLYILHILHRSSNLYVNTELKQKVCS